jgi:methylenetetrahydrofolate dehydrogenase (NADP+)/methenyltetrahydrofolate cyclohydrolase
MHFLKGKPVAQRIDDSIKDLLGNDIAGLSVYLVGTDPSSRIYARSKVKKGAKLGIEVHLKEFDSDTGKEEIIEELKKDAIDGSINSIMIERPLPDSLDMDELMGHVPPEKDVEGLHPENLGRLYLSKPYFIPPTPLGALFMLLHYEVPIEGKIITVIGRSPNVGRPLATLLSMKRDFGNGTVTLAHSRSVDIQALTKRSDIILTAVGRKGLVNGEMVSKGTTLIDLGINPTDDGSIVGDIDIPSMETMDVNVTPTPGGTGPVTVSSMFLNVAISRYRMENEKLKTSIDPIIRKIYQ